MLKSITLLTVTIDLLIPSLEIRKGKMKSLIDNSSPLTLKSEVYNELISTKTRGDISPY